MLLNRWNIYLCWLHNTYTTNLDMIIEYVIHFSFIHYVLLSSECLIKENIRLFHLRNRPKTVCVCVCVV